MELNIKCSTLKKIWKNRVMTSILQNLKKCCSRGRENTNDTVRSVQLHFNK